MGDFAKVESLEALKNIRTGLCQFADSVKIGLEEADAEVHRTLLWLRQEQLVYWRRQMQQCTELVNRAKLELMRKQTEQAQWDTRSSCVDEKKALEAAKRRQREAEQKLERVQHWIRQLDQEAFTYRGAVQRLAQSVETDVPNALAQIDNMVVALESYAAVEYPTDKESMRRAGEQDEEE